MAVKIVMEAGLWYHGINQSNQRNGMRRLGHTEIAEALRREMAGGRWRTGELLPPVAELAERFGAAEYAVRRALHLLRGEGLVGITKHVGAVVTDKAALAWKGRVVFAHSSVSGSYFVHRFACILSNRLEAAGWMVNQVFLDPDGNDGVEASPLARHVAAGIDFAVVVSEYRQFTNLFDQAGVPYVVIGGGARDFPNARAVIKTNAVVCYDELIAAMKARKLKTMLEVDFERRMDRYFVSQLVAAGIGVRRLMCKFESGFDHYSLGEVTAGGRRVVAEFLANPKNRAHLPDVVLFDDDYLAVGGMTAMLEAGLRVPGDIRVVACSNKGNEPVLGNSLARIENDPAATAEAVARYVLALLAGRRAAAPKMELRFIPGESL